MSQQQQQQTTPQQSQPQPVTTAVPSQPQSHSTHNPNLSSIVTNLSNLKSVQTLHQLQQKNNNASVSPMSVEPRNEVCPNCNEELPSPSEKIECMYVSCPQRNASLNPTDTTTPNDTTTEATAAVSTTKTTTATETRRQCPNCNGISHCRQCRIVLCAKCRNTIRVLQCSFCVTFICSRLCFQKLVDNDVAAHSGYLMPHLQYQNPKTRPHNNNLESIPFLSCSHCNKQNCGCTDWNSCFDCRKFYCDECVSTKMTKCGLKECVCATCCQSAKWNRHCRFCTMLGKDQRCNNTFCTKGYCLEHIITDDIQLSDDN